jgi:hypothetical protein
MMHGGLRKIDLQPTVQIRRQAAARRVATDLVYGGTGLEVRRGAVDERRLSVPLIFLGNQRAADMRDHTPELGTLGGLRTSHISAAAESQEVDIVDRDSLSLGQQPPQRTVCSCVRMPAR